jgi:hypothetical protein
MSAKVGVRAGPRSWRMAIRICTAARRGGIAPTPVHSPEQIVELAVASCAFTADRMGDHRIGRMREVVAVVDREEGDDRGRGLAPTAVVSVTWM